MPVRLPAATRTEVFCVSAGGLSTLAPLYMMAPGAEERMARQTTKWAPRWERNITFFKSPVERGVQRISPPVARTVQKVQDKLHLEQAAKKTDRGIKAALDRAGVPRS
ncbi:hypothetical protein QBC42DRAFT_11053 [Cladorrhinum samala]|uniref:Uncharacterized protein n=1 Tax=Cladorrhinum samala TaxID=585594 RepID=A0AAV9HFE3_9PEZI|nr:hypothetical protein QBC42DRAFT_11053 [Cladorrhinum samala]